MIICNSSFEILQFPTDISLLETCGRVCYQSEPKGDPEKFVKNKIVDSGHHSVIEHLLVTVRIITDRGVLAELTRHRLASFSVESSRYCNYSKDKFGNEITVILPSNFVNIVHGSQRTAEYFQYQQWERAMINAENSYMKMLEWGATPQEARGVLPMSLKTEIIMSCNLREWLHIFKLRCSEKSHPDLVFIMRQIRNEFAKKLPVIFSVKN